jgi:spore maturation protein CgeB
MKIVFFGPSSATSEAGYHRRLLYPLLEGIVDRGHHLVYVEREGDAVGEVLPFAEVLDYGDWTTAERARIEVELVGASAVVVASGYAAGPAAVEWLLEAPVPAHVYYEIDPWRTLAALDAGDAATAVTAAQLAAFDIVFSVAGGRAIDAIAARRDGRETISLYESIDPAIFYARAPDEEIACDLALFADRHASSEATFDTYLLEAATALPTHRFVVAGSGWEASANWPRNVELLPAGTADQRTRLYSSARAVLVPIGPNAIDYAMPIELLEPTACGAACVAIDRPGLSDLFEIGSEIVVPERGGDLVPYLTTYGDAALRRLGNLADKRVQHDYVKLRAATRFEQRVARMFYRGHNG